MAYSQLEYPPLLLNIHLQAQLKGVKSMADTPTSQPTFVKRGGRETLYFFRKSARDILAWYVGPEGNWHF